MSNKFNMMAMATVASLFAAPAAMASTLTIDDFADFQIVQDLPSTGAVTSSTQASVVGTILGGSRYLEVDNEQNVENGTSLDAQGGLLSFSNGPGRTGVGYVVYDGPSRAGASDVGFGTNIDIAGLTANLLLGSTSTTVFNFDLSNFNPGNNGATALFTASAWDLDTNQVSFSEIIGAGPVSPKLSLDEFAAGTPFDWTRVGALAFKIDSNEGTFGGVSYGGNEDGINFDGQVGPITIGVIPLPASVLLLLGGLGGFAGLSFVARRRKNA